MFEVNSALGYQVYTAYRTDWNKKIVILRFYDYDSDQYMQVDLGYDKALDLMKYIAKACIDIRDSK